jgi:hypothetical protein
MKKLLVICIGQMCDYRNIGTEDYEKTYIKSSDALKHQMCRYLTNVGYGLESQELDTKGVGTGLPNVQLQEAVEVIDVEDIQAAQDILKSEIAEDRQTVIVMNKPSGESEEEIKSLPDTVIYGSDQINTAAKEIAEYAEAVSEPEMDLSPEDLEELETSGVGTEGFFENLFTSMKSRGEKRYSRLKGLEEKLKELSQTDVKEFEPKGLEGLHYKGKSDITSIITGVKNQTFIATTFNDKMSSSFVNNFKDMAYKVIDFYNSGLINKGYQAILKNQAGNMYKDEKEKARIDFFKKQQEVIYDQFKNVLFGGSDEMQVSGGYVYKLKMAKLLTVVNFLNFESAIKQIKLEKMSELSTKDKTLPNKSALVNLLKELMILAESSKVDKNDVFKSSKELEETYNQIQEKARKPGFKIPLFSKLKRSAEKKEVINLSQIVQQEIQGPLVRISNHSYKVLDAGIQYLESAIKAYD